MFSIVLVWSGSVPFDTDPDSGSSHFLYGSRTREMIRIPQIRIRIHHTAGDDLALHQLALLVILQQWSVTIIRWWSSGSRRSDPPTAGPSYHPATTISNVHLIVIVWLETIWPSTSWPFLSSCNNDQQRSLDGDRLAGHDLSLHQLALLVILQQRSVTIIRWWSSGWTRSVPPPAGSSCHPATTIRKDH